MNLANRLGVSTGSGSGQGPTAAPAGRPVEILGLHLRIVGALHLGTYDRVTDMINTQLGLFRLTDAQVFMRNGNPVSVAVPDLYVSSDEVTLIAELEERHSVRPRQTLVPKTATSLEMVTPGHTITGRVYMPPQATILAFIDTPEPRFIAMTDVRVRSLLDVRAQSEYPFAVVNRRHIVAVSPAAGPAQTSSVFDRIR